MNRYPPWRSACVALACGVLAGAVQANGDPTIVGYVADHTFTTTGRRVYLAFERAWQLEAKHPEANLVVQERPAPRWGTLITIEHDRRVVFQIPGSGAKANPDRIARPAVDAVARYFDQRSTAFYADLDNRDELN